MPFQAWYIFFIFLQFLLIKKENSTLFFWPLSFHSHSSVDPPVLHAQV